MNRPVVVLAVFFTAGILIGEITALKASVAFILAAFSFAAAAAGFLLSWQKNSRLLLVLFLLLGLALSRLWAESGETALLNYDGQRVVLTGLVVSEPDVREDKVFYLLQARELTRAGETSPVSGLVRLQLKGSKRVFAYGDILRVSGLLARPDPAGNPGLFDYRTYLERQGISLILTARGDEAARKVGSGGANPLQGAALAVKQKLSGAATYSLAPAQAAVLNGIIFGVQGLIDRDTRQAFSETGVVHILSVSGLHVGLVLAALLGLLRLLKLPPAWTAPLATPLLLAYAMMTGLNPAVTRAAAMALLFVWAHHFGRDSDWPTTLALAAMVILVRNPLQLYHPGFQLSFAATWGILYLGPFFTSVCAKFLRVPPGATGRLAVQAFAVTLAAQAATVPLVAWYYNLLSPVSLIANILAVPLTGLIMAFGVMAALLGQVWLPLAALVNVSTGYVLDIFLTMVGFFRSLPGAVIYLSTPPVLLAAAWYASLFAAEKVYAGRWGEAAAQLVKRWAPVGAALALVLVLIWWPWHNKREMTVHFIDVGQGDSILVQAPGGRNMLIDTGGRPGEFNAGTGTGDQVVEPYLRKTGVRAIDVLVLTHPHEDHSGGAVSLVKRFPVQMVLVSHAVEEEPSATAADGGREDGVPAAYTTLLDNIEGRGIPVEIALAGDRIALDSDLKIEVLSPAESHTVRSGSDINNSSLVIKVTFGRRSFIFTGDAELDEQRELLRGEADLKADVLKVPHHGSRSLLPALLELVRPEASVISVGAHNTFGHPDQATLNILSAAGTSVYRTDQDGAVIMRTDGNNLEISRGRKSE
ncbi:DNA internalization-related competence protein ComEC/Rec2 [Pelotomaculum propionicicum]|uniref:DNA internalization-related competence protein ComEC/Rec2 n=1 Tax=Pelotomaculum propionicicum TaxID=258475 RepID=UPI003B79D5BE